jgi:hypothetical protein
MSRAEREFEADVSARPVCRSRRSRGGMRGTPALTAWRSKAFAWIALALLVAAPVGAAEPASPEEVLTKYLTAVKAEKFEDAYPLISNAMRQGKSKEVYVKESKTFMGMADVKIFDFTVGKGKVEGDKAQVPNILESQDRFANTLGLTEYELYTLVKEDGSWKVDSQLLLEPSQVATWFPSAKAKKPAPEPGPH